MKWFKMKQKWHLFTTWVNTQIFSSPKNLRVLVFQQKKHGFVEKIHEARKTLRTLIRKEPRHHHVVMSATIKVIMPAMCGDQGGSREGVDGFDDVWSCFFFFSRKWLVAQHNWPQNIDDGKLDDWNTECCGLIHKLLSRSQVAMSRWWGFQVLQAFCSKIIRQDAPCDAPVSSPTRIFAEIFNELDVKKPTWKCWGRHFQFYLLFTKEGGCFKCLRLFHHTELEHTPSNLYQQTIFRNSFHSWRTGGLPWVVRYRGVL